MTTYDNIALIKHYFPQITAEQEACFAQLQPLYTEWNERINVISRKDIDSLYTHHVLHSLAVAAFVNFKPNTQILDVGTGGGFPGIPLAILFPECKFTLIDSIGKKIKVVEAVAEALNLKNVTAQQQRAENVIQSFDFVTGRAVTELSAFVRWVWYKITPNGQNALPNGIICLKGGDLSAEILATRKAFNLSKEQVIEYPIRQFFNEEYYDTKKLVYVQR